MKPRKVKVLSLENAAYIAGVVDGEGTITLARKNKGKNRFLSLTVSNNDLKLLEWIKRNIGVGVITKKRHYKENHLLSFTYQISNTQAYDLVAQVYPFLRSCKKLRAGIVLGNYHKLTPRNGKYTPAMLARRELFIQRFFSLKTATSRVFDSFKV